MEPMFDWFLNTFLPKRAKVFRALAGIESIGPEWVKISEADDILVRHVSRKSLDTNISRYVRNFVKDMESRIRPEVALFCSNTVLK